LLLWYRRLAEYGADRFAVLVVGEAAIAARALARVAAGAEVAEGVAFETLIEQAEELERSPLGWLQQALSSHPFVGSRLRAMREWEVSLNVGCRVREWGVECGEDARVAGENVETSP
ncbi:MAG: M48 family metalloprotease, partial [Ardenticatenaceae bacterium]